MSISFEFIFTLILLIGSVVAWRYRQATIVDHYGAEPQWRVGRTALIVLLSLTGLFGFLSVAYTVPVRNVGIVTEFNKPTGRVTGSGLKFVWPWQRVADFDASIQSSDHLTSERCTTVRIGSLATACVEHQVQWRVTETAAPRLYNDYKGDFGRMRDTLVEPRIRTAVNTVFATYNPLSQVNLQTGQVGFDGAAHAKALEAELNRVISSDIVIVSVAVPFVHHDAKTEDNIRQFQDVIARARILQQMEANAVKEKLVSDLQRQFLTAEYIRNKCVEESVKLGLHPGLCMMSGGLVSVPTTK